MADETLLNKWNEISTTLNLDLLCQSPNKQGRGGGTGQNNKTKPAFFRKINKLICEQTLATQREGGTTGTTGTTEIINLRIEGGSVQIVEKIVEKKKESEKVLNSDVLETIGKYLTALDYANYKTAIKLPEKNSMDGLTTYVSFLFNIKDICKTFIQKLQAQRTKDGPQRTQIPNITGVKFSIHLNDSKGSLPVSISIDSYLKETRIYSRDFRISEDINEDIDTPNAYLPFLKDLENMKPYISQLNFNNLTIDFKHILAFHLDEGLQESNDQSGEVFRFKPDEFILDNIFVNLINQFVTDFQTYISNLTPSKANALLQNSIEQLRNKLDAAFQRSNLNIVSQTPPEEDFAWRKMHPFLLQGNDVERLSKPAYLIIIKILSILESLCRPRQQTPAQDGQATKPIPKWCTGQPGVNSFINSIITSLNTDPNKNTIDALTNKTNLFVEGSYNKNKLIIRLYYDEDSNSNPPECRYVDFTFDMIKNTSTSGAGKHKPPRKGSYESMKVADLRERCKKRGVKIPKAATKKDIIELLRNKRKTK